MFVFVVVFEMKSYLNVAFIYSKLIKVFVFFLLFLLFKFNIIKT
jgi:hypothetical protein